MKCTHHEAQKSLFSFGLMGAESGEDHELVQTEREIDREEMVEIVSKKYSGKTGRNSKSLLRIRSMAT